MEYLQYEIEVMISDRMFVVLNLIINGIPSILRYTLQDIV